MGTFRNYSFHRAFGKLGLPSYVLDYESLPISQNSILLPLWSNYPQLVLLNRHTLLFRAPADSRNKMVILIIIIYVGTGGTCPHFRKLLVKVPLCSLKNCQFLFMRVPLNTCAHTFLMFPKSVLIIVLCHLEVFFLSFCLLSE